VGHIEDVDRSLATTLFDTLKEAQRVTAALQQHIEDRAAELAEPKIAEARTRFERGLVALKESAAQAEQRNTDLLAEMRRQLAALDKYRDQLESMLRAYGIDPRTGFALTTSRAGDALLDGLARLIYAGVEDYFDRPPGTFHTLPPGERDKWRGAAQHALESTVDHVIGAGRPIWWTGE
jgi:hypothetical protein